MHCPLNNKINTEMTVVRKPQLRKHLIRVIWMSSAIHRHHFDS